MPEPRPDAMTELVRILREQLDHKDERIATLEKLLEDANRRIDEQQRLMVRLLERSFDRSWAQSDGFAAHAAPPLISAAETDTDAPAEAGEASTEIDQDAIGRNDEGEQPASHAINVWQALEEPVRSEVFEDAEAEQPVAVLNRADVNLPDIGPQIEVIAEAVVAAARRAPVAEDVLSTSEHAGDGASEREALAGSLQMYVDAKDEVETTLKLDRNKLRKGHRQMDRAKRGFLPWRRNREA